jgi:hypothetical protein
MAEIIRTTFFTIYSYPDRIEIYNAWDEYRDYGLVLHNEAQIEELATICQNLTFSKKAFDPLKIFEFPEIDDKK